MTDIVFCEACDERYHARKWVLEGANSWWLVDQHALSRLFECETDAIQYAKKHKLEVVFRGGDGLTIKTLQQLVNEKREQPAPIPNGLIAVWDLVLADMAARDDLGRNRYGVPLQPHNGRDALRDAYEEALDLVVYLRQAIYERDSK